MSAWTPTRAALHLAVALLVALALGAFASPTGAGPGAPSPPAPAGRSAGCSVPQRAGDRYLAVPGGEDVRNVLLHVPRRALPGPAALVLAFHGAGGSGAFMSRYSGLARVADRAGFVVAFPTAAGPRGRWTLGEEPGEERPDDVAFTRRLLDATLASACVDTARVSGAGVSNGGGLVARLGCELSDRLAAVVVVSGGFAALPACRPVRPVAVLEIHGSDDPVVPYRGKGDGAGSVPRWLDGWARRDGCRAVPSRTRVARRVVRVDWGRCRAGSTVAHLLILGGEHQWPGATPPDPGPASAVSGADEVWRFVADKRRAAPR